VQRVDVEEDGGFVGFEAQGLGCWGGGGGCHIVRLVEFQGELPVCRTRPWEN
jgi:hypothetical protein